MPDGSKYIRIIGRREMVFFPEWNLGPVEAKIDTGAYTGALHADDIRETKNEKGEPCLSFVLRKEFYPNLKENVTLFVHDYFSKPIRNSFGEEENRYIIRTKIKIGKKIIRTRISLTDRSTMKYQVLIGRRLIKGKFMLDVSEVHLNGKKIKLC
ncbi:MAG: ATP-dependent zinc protease [Bacteroidia bacterium]|nr:ATP-dependent zinc protease [Bacteroidia bacterium]